MNKDAQRLGRLAKGKPKKLSPEESKRRSEHMKRVGRANAKGAKP